MISSSMGIYNVKRNRAVALLILLLL